MKKLALGFALLALGGCATMSSTVRARGAHAFACPADSVQVTEIANNTYEATGCGKTQVFSCVLGQGGITCVPEGTAVPASR